MGALSWGLDLATFEGVPVRLHGFEMADVAMLSSVFVAQLLRQVRGPAGRLLCENASFSLTLIQCLQLSLQVHGHLVGFSMNQSVPDFRK